MMEGRTDPCGAQKILTKKMITMFHFNRKANKISTCKSNPLRNSHESNATF